MPSPHRLHIGGLALLLAPGLALAAFAVLADLLRGGQLTHDWGSGQSMLLASGLAIAWLGWLVHRKARRDEDSGRRRYPRTVAFVLLPLLIMVVLPLAAAEAICRWLPGGDQALGDYRQRDATLGFALTPSRTYRVISRPKKFDIRVRIDRHGFRLGPGSPAEVSEAAVAVVGDSHAFGYGVAEDQTLAAWLHRRLDDAKRPSAVLNAGVPGFGLGQMLLRIRSLASLPAGAAVVVYVNPVNDLVNLSSAVDYHCPKPHATSVDGRLKFVWHDAPVCDTPYLFSQPFASLNDAFALDDGCRWYRSALWQRIQHRSQAPTVSDRGVVLLEDATSEAQFLATDRQTILDHPLQVASRFWPEMPQFAEPRETLSRLTAMVLRAMQAEADQRGWHLLVVVAEEAFAHQPFWQQRLEQIQQANPHLPLVPGWSRGMLIDQLRAAAIETIVVDYAGLQADGALGQADLAAMYVDNDDHTSGEAFRVIAAAVADRLLATAVAADGAKP